MPKNDMGAVASRLLPTHLLAFSIQYPYQLGKIHIPIPLKNKKGVM